METREFLSRVSAPLDNLVVSLWKPDPSGKSKLGIFWNRGSFSDLDDAVAAIQMWDRDPEWTVYYSIGRMADNAYVKDDGSTGYYRKQENATWFKCLCFDMDIGADHKYKTQKEGHEALIAALGKIGLPTPMVVSSGRGIHYYWPLTEPLPKAHWEKASIALRLALAEHEVEIDVSKIHDASMVLRPAGTHHKKQTPWKEVKVVQDCPDYPIELLIPPLKPWLGKSTAAKTAAPKKQMSGIAAAVLKNANLIIPTIAKKCKQIGALLASGGEFDADGKPVSEQLWRGSLGLASYAVDQEEAMVMLCGKYPDFDHHANMRKMSMWDTPPPTCAYFEKYCAGGCVGCPYKGQVVGPGSLNEEPASAIPLPPTAEATTLTPVVYTLPSGYYVSNGKICMDVEKEVKDKGEDGKTITRTVKSKQVVCPYEMHVLGLYTDLNSTGTTASLAIKYPQDGWKTHEMPLKAAYGGAEFVNFLHAKNLIIKTEGLVHSTRSFLMTYMEWVQENRPTGKDFLRFGWQKDGSFLCGNTLVGDPTGNTERRLKGSAKTWEDKVHAFGDRDIWAETTKYADLPGGEFFGVGYLVGAVGVLHNVQGATTPVISFYSSETGTGKTLALMSGSSLFMNPIPQLMFSPKDTENSLYHCMGTLGSLSAAIDEITNMNDDQRAGDMAYTASNGREKNRLDSNGQLREPHEWFAPLRVSTNKSLYEMYDSYMAKNDPVKLRTFQFVMDDRTFANAYGDTIFHLLKNNYGFAMPELAKAVILNGGMAAVWHAGVELFNKDFGFVFDGKERFFKNTIIASYIVGKLGQELGLFRFDLERLINFMLKRVVELRGESVLAQRDAFDVLGQYLQEHNHQLIVCREEAGTKNPQVQFPVPDHATARMDIVWDKHNSVLPGSKLYINKNALRMWMKRNQGSLEQLLAELTNLNALSHPNERVTIYKGCQRQNPGQAFCISVDLMHPRMSVALNGGKPMLVTSPMAAVLGGTAPSPVAATP